MKKTILCTEDNPLHLQISQEESLRIEELEVSGYLDEDDYELLTEMSGEKGRLRYLDLYGVTESFPGPDDMGCFCIGEEDLAIYSGSFNDSIRLEKIIFPNNLIGIGHSSFNDCPNLVIDYLPETVRSIGNYSFQGCPKLKTVFVPSDCSLILHGQLPESEFGGSVENFDSDHRKWPLNPKGEWIYRENFGIEFFVVDGVLFLEMDWCQTLLALDKYPAMNRRTTYEVPIETAAAYYEDKDTISPLGIRAYAFCGCKYLKTLILQDCMMETHAIYNCPALETIIFKGRACGERVSSWDIDWSHVITKCPNLQDIYLYAEDPREISFGLFKDLENLGDIVLHVPCFCAEKYRNHVIYVDGYNNQWILSYLEPFEPANEDDLKEWRRFKRIEEFDPIDFIEPIE